MKARAILVSFCWAVTAAAWGPHWDITQSGIGALTTNHVVLRQLGPELPQLTNYCWLPDFKRLPFRSIEDDFYADDFLLFPGMTRHLDHICPEVEQAYAPYFRRALQALRTESAPNAARWIGSLLHFIQDTGSPPHAARIRGDLHIRMENWVDRTKIAIPGHVPRLLGTNDDSAVQALELRMQELIAFSKPRGQRLRASVLVGNRRAVEPVALESALECARVTADVLHTLAYLAHRSPANGVTLSGVVQTRPAISDGRFPARLFLHGTAVATLAHSDGRFLVRGFQRGAVRLTVMKPGSVTLVTNLVMGSGTTNVVLALAPSGDLVRNGDFAVHWLRPDAPDCWTRVGMMWEGEVVALRSGQRYRVEAGFHPGADGDVLVRWSSEQPFILPKPLRGPRIHSQLLTPGNSGFTFTATPNIALMQLAVRAAGHPTNVVGRVSIKPVSD